MLMGASGLTFPKLLKTEFITAICEHEVNFYVQTHMLCLEEDMFLLCWDIVPWQICWDVGCIGLRNVLNILQALLQQLSS
jgi:hypothetical protein